jgi:glycosyltransferase involved in cell wall biosynthesis
MRKPYLIVAADFVETGGMDVANHGLARYLANRGHEVHLVTHRAEDDLVGRSNVVIHHAPKPAGSYLLGEPLLDWIGRFWAPRIAARGGRVVVNGGNCQWADINWVHYVHAAFPPQQAGTLPRRLKSRIAHRRFLTGEARALRRARVVIVNSERTKQDVQNLGIPGEKIYTAYYGIDSARFRPPTVSERVAARASLGWPDDRPVVAFVGALGDRRKGFDTLFAAWRALCADPGWDADLIVIGTGAELPRWVARANEAGLESRVRFLGFRTDVPRLIAACDALVAPTRYEAYGLAVQEALCCAVPALVTRTAGVAERYPGNLQDLLIPDPDDPLDLAARLRGWRERSAAYRRATASLSAVLRSHTWDDMAAQMESVFEANT